MEKFKSFLKIINTILDELIHWLIPALTLYLLISLIIDRQENKEIKEKLIDKISINVEADTNK